MVSNTAPVPPPLPGAALAACGQPGATEQASQTLKPATIRFTPANGPGTDVRTFSIPRSTAQPDASWDFMKWLMQPKAQVHLGRAGYGVPGLKSASDPTFRESDLKDKNWKLIPEGLNHDVPLAYNPIAQTFKTHYNTRATDFLSGKMKAREWLDQGCLDSDGKIRELGWKKKG